MRRGPKPAKSKEAKPPIGRKSSKDDNDASVRDLEKRLAEAVQRETEALARETATDEILRIISSSPTSIQPVVEAVVESAARLTGAFDVAMFLRARDSLRLVAHHGPIPIHSTLPLVRGTSNGRAVLDGRIVHLADMQAEADEFPEGKANAVRMGHRAILCVPLMREGIAIGTIHLRRTEAGLFTERQVALLQTFAAQAVIAIENVELFNETKEALEQQTATSEILRVISSSPTDIQPVFDAVAENAARLCEAFDALIYRRDGDRLRLVAHYGLIPPPGPIGEFTHPLGRGMATGRSVLDAQTIHFADLQIENDEFPEGSVNARQLGFRATLNVPLIREGVAIGCIVLRRREAELFTDRQVALLQTFADQAVIAIENVRLFNETKEALERQTATSEILRVISQSQTDVQPVFDTIAENARLLFRAWYAAVYRLDREFLQLVARRGGLSGPMEPVHERVHVDRGSLRGRAILDRALVHIADIAIDRDVTEMTRRIADSVGWRSALFTPMLRDGEPIGLIVVTRAEPGAFSDGEVALLQTFADQAVIAIENVRLFTELQEKNTALTEAHGRVTEALEQQTATAEILRVISESQTEVQPVFEAIADSAMRLFRAWSALVFRYDGELLSLAAARGGLPGSSGSFLARFQAPRRPDDDTIHGRTVITRAVQHIADVEADAYRNHHVRRSASERGFRSVVWVPMLRGNEAVGAIGVSRVQSGGFSDAEIALLQTFADQAVIAIENVRLFKELEAANRELAAASQHKSEFLANMSHELRTPLNAIIGFSEVLSEKMFGELNEKQEEYSKDIHASGQHLLSLINDILDLSKIEAGRMELELTDFHLPTALESALTLVRERAGRRGIALQMNVDSRLGQIQADERKIRQVVLNLLSNAIKFTPEGGRIEVGAVTKDGVVEVSVSDTGVGIAPEDQEAVFEEFRQVGTADKKVEGTGLGLTLCRKFVELHGGRIWVKSQVGAGSTFTFTIPVGRGE